MEPPPIIGRDRLNNHLFKHHLLKYPIKMRPNLQLPIIGHVTDLKAIERDTLGCTPNMVLIGMDRGMMVRNGKVMELLGRDTVEHRIKVLGMDMVLTGMDMVGMVDLGTVEGGTDQVTSLPPLRQARSSAKR